MRGARGGGSSGDSGCGVSETTAAAASRQAFAAREALALRVLLLAKGANASSIADPSQFGMHGHCGDYYLHDTTCE